MIQILALSTMSDEALFELVKENRKDAYEEIYNRFKGVLYLHGYKILGDREEVRDVVQEVFVTLWVKKESLRINNLSAYLYSSIRNRVIDRLSRRNSKNRYVESMSFFVEHETYQVPDRILYAKELHAMIELEVEALPEKMRRTFELSRKQHLSHREIGDRLGIAETTVRKQVNNALKILRSKFDDKNIALFLFFIYSIGC